MFTILMGNIISPLYGSLKSFYFSPGHIHCSSLLDSRGFWASFPLPSPFRVWLYAIHFLLTSHGLNITHPYLRGFTCWSSGVHMPHVIWLSKLISDDQCLCPLTEPTRTNPSRYEISAWVPSWLHVKSLTFETHIDKKVSICNLKGKALLSKTTVINLAFG